MLPLGKVAMYEYGKLKVVSLGHFSKHWVVNSLALELFSLGFNYQVLCDTNYRKETFA